MAFPDNFLWGGAVAAHQVEGGLIGMEIKSDADTCPHTNRAHKLSPLWRPERAAYRRAHRR